jgi:hypothetical protein
MPRSSTRGLNHRYVRAGVVCGWGRGVQAVVEYKRVYEHVSTAYPYWNRHGGRDHMWMMFHDEGACFAPKEIWPSIMITHWGRKVPVCVRLNYVPSPVPKPQSCGRPLADALVGVVTWFATELSLSLYPSRRRCPTARTRSTRIRGRRCT